jgi:hypothetical protein
VVGEVGDGLGSIGDPKTEGGAGVTDEVGGDFVVADLVGAGPEIMKSKSGKVADPHWKQGRGEVPAEALAQSHGRRSRPPQMHFDVFAESRAKKAEALKVIEMEVGEQHVDPRWARIENLVEAREA